MGLYKEKDEIFGIFESSRLRPEAELRSINFSKIGIGLLF